MRHLAHGGWKVVLGAVGIALSAGAFPAGGGEAEPLIVHEWGVLDIPATPADATPFDLPDFVLTRERLVPDRGMGIERAPVIYLYPPAGLEMCNVRVTFPTGGACAWWPMADVTRSPGGAREAEDRRFMSPSVCISELVWSVTFGAGNEPPAVPEGHWIGYARDVDAPVLSAHPPAGAGPRDAREGSGPQKEHFLFYEGTIDYANPVVVEGTEVSPVVRNGGDHAMLDALWIEGGAVACYVPLGDIVAGASVTVPSLRRSITADGAERDLVGRLVASGLFEKEAVAMARTWRSAFFERPGTRVVYRWPQEVYDRLLPLDVTAGAPVLQTRVMLVCRNGIVMGDPARIRALVAQLGAAEFNSREEATESLARLGSAAGPALREAARSEDPEIRSRAEHLLSRLGEPVATVR